LALTPECLKVVCGDALNPAQVENAVKGSDAVSSTLGPKGKPAVMAAERTKNIVSAMEKQGVKRLVQSFLWESVTQHESDTHQRR
jgi:putative NADH-flavin reductase